VSSWNVHFRPLKILTCLGETLKRIWKKNVQPGKEDLRRIQFVGGREFRSGVEAEKTRTLSSDVPGKRNFREKVMKKNLKRGDVKLAGRDEQGHQPKAKKVNERILGKSKPLKGEERKEKSVGVGENSLKSTGKANLWWRRVCAGKNTWQTKKTQAWGTELT